MPAYSFQPRFVAPIQAGTKGGTIRKARTVVGTGRVARTRAQTIGGHAYPGERLALYCRQRHPSGFLVAEKRCLEVEPIELNFDAAAIAFLAREYLIDQPEDLDAFARFDGFDSWADLGAFWQATHDLPVFEGWHIRWRPWPIGGQ